MEETNKYSSMCSKCGKKKENMWYFSEKQQVLCPECHLSSTENTPEYRKWLEEYCPRSVAEKSELDSMQDLKRKIDDYMRSQYNN